MSQITAWPSLLTFRRFFRVHTAHNAAEARVIVDKQPIELVLSDQRMPGESGLSLLSDLKQRYPNLPRILITGSTENSIKEKAQTEGLIRAYVTKPWDVQKLHDLIRKILSNPS